MHVTRAVDVPGDLAQALANARQSILSLGWSISDDSGAWLRCRTGEWKGNVEIEIAAAPVPPGTRLTIDGEPAVFGVGPFWDAQVTNSVDRLVAAIGGRASTIRLSNLPEPLSSQVGGLPSAPQQAFQDAREIFKEPAAQPTESELTFVPGVAAGVAARWFLDKVGGAVVTYFVHKGIAKVMEGDSEGMEGKTEYDIGSGRLLIRWADGSVTEPRNEIDLSD